MNTPQPDSLPPEYRGDFIKSERPSMNTPQPSCERRDNMNTTIGTCGNCGGRVSVPTTWSATVPPTPMCESCGSVPLNPHGPPMPMQPIPRPQQPIGSLLESMANLSPEARPHE